MNFKRLIHVLVTALLFSFAACSSPAEHDFPSDYADEGDSGNILSSGLQTRKIAYSAKMNLEVDNISKTIDDIEDIIAEYNESDETQSYVASSEADISKINHSAVMVIKVSAERLDLFLDDAGGLGTVTYKKKSSEDLTKQYQNYDAERQALETELALLHEAHENSTDPSQSVIYLERITELNTRLNQIINAMNSIDDRVLLSTVELYIYGNGQSPIEESFDTTIGKVFFGSLDALLQLGKFLLLAIIAIAPFAVVLGGGAVAVAVPIYIIKKKQKNNHDD